MGYATIGERTMLESWMFWTIASIGIAAALIVIFARRSRSETTTTITGTREEVLQHLAAEQSPEEREEDRLYAIAFEVENAYNTNYDNAEAVVAIAKVLGAIESEEDRRKVLNLIKREWTGEFRELVEEAALKAAAENTQPPIAQL